MEISQAIKKFFSKKESRKNLILCSLSLIFLISVVWMLCIHTVHRSIENFKSDDWQTRERAAKTLGRIGQPAVGSLIDALENEDAEIRWRAARSLGEIGDSGTIESLAKALKDEDRRVRYRAIEALEKIGDDSVIEPLIFALEDEDIDVRERTVAALESIGRKREKAMETLFGVALRNKNIDIRHRAFVALIRITTNKDLALLDLDTARRFGTDSEKWRKWWEENKNEFNRKK